MLSAVNCHKRLNIHGRKQQKLTPSPLLKVKKKIKEDKFYIHGGHILHSADRKERKSKVNTAKGTRDRRVRLSPTTAIDFYDVLDRLGYDRPSKAIDWLLKEAKEAIDELSPCLPSIQQESDKTLKSENLGIRNESDFSSLIELQTGGSGDYFNSKPPENSLLSTSYLQLIDTNFDLEGVCYPNSGETLMSFPLSSPQASIHGDMYSQREPLQSIFNSYASLNQFSCTGYEEAIDVLSTMNPLFRN